MTEQSKSFNQWCVVELFGHQQIAGQVTEQEIAGSAFVRVDVPETESQPAFTRFYGSSAIYSITPVSEDVARMAAAQLYRKPVTVYIPELSQRPRLEVESEDNGGNSDIDPELGW